jgi:hypothetical protein
MNSRFLELIALCFVLTLSEVPAAIPARVIFDTDIGGDVDDAEWGLA